MHHILVTEVLILLLIGMPLALLMRRFGLSSLLAYLVAGAMAAVFGLTDSPEVTTLAEIGATLLLFTIGLEMDLRMIRRQLRQIVIAAMGQLGSTIALGTWLLHLLGLSWPAAFAIGSCLGLSSTLVVIRALDERHLRERREGQTVLGVLLTQDLCLPLLLVALTLVLPGDGAERPSLWLQGLGLVGILGLTVLLRAGLADSILGRLFATRLPELEVAAGVLAALGAAWFSVHMGLGEAVGAFCAGIALGSDQHRRTIETSMRSLEGLFAIVFFTSIGLQFDLGYVLAEPLLVCGALLVSVLMKAVLAALALRLSGLDWRGAIGSGLMLGQVGEFSFVLAATAFGGGAGVLEEQHFKLVVAVTCLSLALTPILIALGTPLLPRSILERITGRSQTVVVAGLGPVGNTVVQALHDAGADLLLIDRNPKLLEPWANTSGVRCLQGQIEAVEQWLPQLGARPRAVVLAFPIPDTSALVAERLRAHDPELVLVARCPYRAQIPILTQAGIQHVICDEDATAAALQPLITNQLIQQAKTERLGS
jgi:Kef-type K+ transport system membrane component KefB